jgi:dTMP kinase
MSGLFITFEGGEGTGKTTQIKRLADYFASLDRAVVLTREPGGTPVAEALRSLLVNGDPGSLSSTAEALLNAAARDSHLRHVIRPALERGDTVLCDRFMDSTRAYQGDAGDCPLLLIDALEDHVVDLTRPDLTFIFDLDPVVGLKRAAERGQGLEDRYERKGLAFHQALRAGFLAIAKDDPARCVVIDASASVDVIHVEILAHIESRLDQ